MAFFGLKHKRHYFCEKNQKKSKKKTVVLPYGPLHQLGKPCAFDSADRFSCCSWYKK